MKTPSFYQRLWRCGFVKVIGGQVCIDKQAACDYLFCSVRTLDRWLTDDNPCKRALRLLTIKERIIPDTWDEQFKFDRNDKLICPGYPLGLTREQVKYFATTHANYQKRDNENSLLRQLLDENVDLAGHAAMKKRLMALNNELSLLVNDPIFKAIRMAPDKVQQHFMF